MFKKKGGLAFKPKIPSARPRPAIASSQSQSAKPVETPVAPNLTAQQSAIHTPQLSPPESPSPDAATSISEQIEPPAKELQPVPVASTSQGEILGKLIEKPQPSIETLVDIFTNGEASKSDAPSIETTPAEHQPDPAITPALAISVAPEQSQERHESPSETPEIATPETSISTSDETPAPAPTKSKALPKPRTRKAAAKTKEAIEADGEVAKPKKRTRRSAVQHADTGDESSEPATKKPRNRNPTPGEAKARKTRSVTPEDAENQVVDLQKLTMADLTNDLRIGKKFSRHDELRERERQKRLKAKLKEDGIDMSEADGGFETPKSSSSQPPPAPSSSTPGGQGSGVQLRIVDGQIVLDQSSLVLDRHARAAATQGDMEIIEENDFTRLITSSSFMTTSKLKGPNIWTSEETERFYHGLRMFGTDFQMLAAMFPGKSRRHVKLKYNREERHCPGLVTEAVSGLKTVKMDIEEYKAATGAEFESVESIEAEHNRIAEEFENEQKRIADEQAEIMRKKREQLFADDDGSGTMDQEGIVQKKKKSKKKRMEEAGAYGDVEVIQEL